MENEELVLQIQAGQNKVQNMEQLYLQNRRFIYGNAKKYAAYADIDDLMQEAYFALEKAVEGFEPKQDNKFITYFFFWLQYVFRRYIANCGRVKRIPVHELERISKYKKYISSCKENGIEPTDFAICRELGLTDAQLKKLRKAMFEADCISINDTAPGTDNLTVEDSLADPLELEEQVLDSVAREWAENLIWQIVDELEEREAQVIIGRYKEDATLTEIAKRLNISNESVRQVERKALTILRNKREIKHIAEIYGYMNPYKGTGFTSFKYHGSAVENAAIRHIEGQEKIKALKRDITNTKAEIKGTLNIDELFEQVLNLASQ